MLRASLGKVVHTVKRAGTYAAKVSHKELHKIAVHVRAVPVCFGPASPDAGVELLRQLFLQCMLHSCCLVYRCK